MRLQLLITSLILSSVAFGHFNLKGTQRGGWPFGKDGYLDLGCGPGGFCGDYPVTPGTYDFAALLSDGSGGLYCQNDTSSGETPTDGWFMMGVAGQFDFNSGLSFSCGGATGNGGTFTATAPDGTPLSYTQFGYDAGAGGNSPVACGQVGGNSLYGNGGGGASCGNSGATASDAIHGGEGAPQSGSSDYTPGGLTFSGDGGQGGDNEPDGAGGGGGVRGAYGNGVYLKFAGPVNFHGTCVDASGLNGGNGGAGGSGLGENGVGGSGGGGGVGAEGGKISVVIRKGMGSVPCFSVSHGSGGAGGIAGTGAHAAGNPGVAGDEPSVNGTASGTNNTNF